MIEMFRALDCGRCGACDRCAWHAVRALYRRCLVWALRGAALVALAMWLEGFLTVVPGVAGAYCAWKCGEFSRLTHRAIQAQLRAERTWR